MSDPEAKPKPDAATELAGALVSPPTGEAKPNQEALAELQKAYADGVTRTNRFIISTLIILSLLAIVVGQELREYRKEDEKLKKEIETARKLFNLSVKDLKKLHAEAPSSLKHPEGRETTGLDLKNLPQLRTPIKELNDVQALTWPSRRTGR